MNSVAFIINILYVYMHLLLSQFVLKEDIRADYISVFLPPGLLPENDNRIYSSESGHLRGPG